MGSQSGKTVSVGGTFSTFTGKAVAADTPRESIAVSSTIKVAASGHVWVISPSPSNR